ncbi:MAG: hypothetical protein ACHQC8_02395 [Solirubrobacterales bacterium]
MECEYEWSDDYEYSGPACALEKGHAGPHQVTWETRPEDICLAGGHLWDLWMPYLPKHPAALSGFSDWKLPPMRERACLRCGRQDYDGGERNPDISDVLVASLLGRVEIRNIGTDMGYMPGPGSAITWVEDRLAPRPWRPE